MINENDLQSAESNDASRIKIWVEDAVMFAPVFDMHTHLFAPEFGDLNLWGVDELLTYHYLIAELFRSSPVSPEQFWRLDKQSQADLIWRVLFVEQTPLSEATRGVVTTLTALGLDARMKDLREAREFFASLKTEDYIERVMNLANVSDIVMTNDPFDEREKSVWQNEKPFDARFHAALRLDRLLNDWRETVAQLAENNYRVQENLDDATIKEVCRFLEEWIARMKPLYLAVSLPDDFRFPDESPRHKLLTEAVFPTARIHDLPVALMIGVRRGVNPALRLAGDGVGRADVGAVARICAENPENRFLVTILSHENQYELCVTVRKFSNLLPFGCWWFLNNPSIISEITTQRIELLGTSFIPQHSDARVFDQIIYKWRHSRTVISNVLNESYQSLSSSGWTVTRDEIRRDVERFFSGNFRAWANLPDTSAKIQTNEAKAERA